MLCIQKRKREILQKKNNTLMVIKHLPYILVVSFLRPREHGVIVMRFTCIFLLHAMVAVYRVLCVESPYDGGTKFFYRSH